ncbi:hypothetical protein LVY74_00640 [Acinetobacter sp. ME22]|uniref:hypothetical protein n=1 Tax=Acinetobacter sp. ME22 TaxID=2904802 RepID=UPI001EDB9EA7|nr:hypothetical protein [Acinetobacter sp. ME22]MCG2572066.1 hypothetical protein [Acinetobacter sp. ME22]
MDTLNFTTPFIDRFAQDGLETDLLNAFKAVMANDVQSGLQDLVDYGCPHMGSATVIERFTKQDGLVVLRREDVADQLMQVIYSTWISLGSERGLNFLEFVLTMLWGNNWEVIRLWHQIDQIQQYPRFLSETEQSGYFLTSRINLEISEDVELSEIVELSPSVRKLVPANIVLKVIALALNRDLGLSKIGVACAAKPMNFIRMGVDYDRYTGFGLPYLFNVIYDALTGIANATWSEDDEVSGFKLYRCQESMALLTLNTILERAFNPEDYQNNFIDYAQNFTASSLATSSNFSVKFSQMALDNQTLQLTALLTLAKSFDGTSYTFSESGSVSTTINDLIAIIVDRWQAAKNYSLINFVGVTGLGNVIANNAWFLSSQGVIYYNAVNPQYYASFYQVQSVTYSYTSFENAAYTYYVNVILANKTDNDDYGDFVSATHSCSTSDLACQVEIVYQSTSDPELTNTLTITVDQVENAEYYQYWYQYDDVNYSFTSFEQAAENYYNRVILPNKTETDDYGAFQSVSHSCGVTDASCSLTIQYSTADDPNLSNSLTLIFSCVENPDYDADPSSYNQIELSGADVTEYLESYLQDNLESEDSVSFILDASAGDKIYGNNALAESFTQILLDAMQARTATISPLPILMCTTTDQAYADHFYLDEGKNYFYRMSAYSSTKEKLSASEATISV